jgi:MoxR-like ATPase
MRLDPPVMPASDPGTGKAGSRAVLLIDEIDKADPDLPNNLLEPLGSLQFTVQETGRLITSQTVPLIIITTNNERDLPAAFYRRCAVLFLKEHERDDLIRIARAHFADHAPPVTDELAGSIADMLFAVANRPGQRGGRRPSTAEYLDAVRTCLRLGVRPSDGGEWAHIEQLTLSKVDPAAK